MTISPTTNTNIPVLTVCVCVRTMIRISTCLSASTEEDTGKEGQWNHTIYHCI